MYETIISDKDSSHFKFGINKAKALKDTQDSRKEDYCNSVVERDSRKMYQMRNFVELIFEIIQALIIPVENKIDTPQNKFVAIKSKYCNGCSEKLSSLC